MLIHVVNPNSTRAMTDKARMAAVACAGPGTSILATNPATSPASIEGHTDQAHALPAMLALIAKAEAQGAAAHVVACFDDPGLHAAREIATGPVVGICQAAIQVAMTIAARFSIVTTLPRSVPIIEDLVMAYGAGHACRRVRSAQIEVLALEHDVGGSFDRIAEQIRRAAAEDGAEAVILGCAGMADLTSRLETVTGIPVVEGVTAAVKLAEALVGARYRTSKVGSYAAPRQKKIAGHSLQTAGQEGDQDDDEYRVGM